MSVSLNELLIYITFLILRILYPDMKVNLNLYILYQKSVEYVGEYVVCPVHYIFVHCTERFVTESLVCRLVSREWKIMSL